MSLSSNQYVTLAAIVILVLTLPLTWQIVDVRVAQATVQQEPAPVQQGPAPVPQDRATTQVPSAGDPTPQTPSSSDHPSQTPSPSDRPAQTPAVQTATPQAPTRQEPTPQTPPDYDGDGIDDDTDRCPTRPETVNGFQDGDGCPDVVTTTRAS